MTGDQKNPSLDQLLGDVLPTAEEDFATIFHAMYELTNKKVKKPSAEQIKILAHRMAMESQKRQQETPERSI